MDSAVCPLTVAVDASLWLGPVWARPKKAPLQVDPCATKHVTSAWLSRLSMFVLITHVLGVDTFVANAKHGRFRSVHRGSTRLQIECYGSLNPFMPH